MYQYLNYFIPLFLGWFFCQVPKVIYTCIRQKPDHFFEVLVSSGGMPSTHTASTMALVTRIAFAEQFKGPLFALAVVFACVTMYDAFNVRLACGRVTERMNSVIDKVYADSDPDKPEKLKVVNGHTFAEVVVGFCIGVAVGTVYSLVEAHFLG